MHELVELVKAEFQKHFEGDPIIVISPGRINLLGEHTDYNGGHVMPAAIDKGIVMAITRNGNNHLNLRSIDFNDARNLSLQDPQPLGDWSDYVTGVVLEMKRKDQRVEGVDMVFSGNVPIGSGLSSSAALECGVALGLNELYHTELDKYQLSLISQSAENNYVGVQCGLMDQYASLFGKVNNILCLDCKTNTHQYLQLNLEGYDLILCNSGVNHSLAESDYNVRREECQEGLKLIQEGHPEVEFLCDSDVDTLSTLKSGFSEIVYKRCKYVIEENLRVKEACDCIKQGDILRLGQLMYQTHHGLSKEFEVSCPELDYLVDITKEEQGIIGSRMMGGGFGGCTINLVQSDRLEFFNQDLMEDYKKRFGKQLSYINVKLSDGGKIIH